MDIFRTADPGRRFPPGGYSRPAPWIVEAFNVSAAVFLLVLTLPFFAFITFVLWLRQGRPVLYRGWRLGLNKEPFVMYKFRTLVQDAEGRLSGEILTSSPELITPAGKFLRDTRLDELPQLWNVIKRDMDLVGPRPVRPVVYSALCSHIPDYDRRFRVRPGVIGISQLFTPHSSPKRLRSLIDNYLLKKKERLWWNIYALGLTGCVLLRTIVIKSVSLVYRRIICQKLLRLYREKRRYERVPVRKGAAYRKTTRPGEKRYEYLGEIKDLNEEAFRLKSRGELDDVFPCTVKLQKIVEDVGRRSPKEKHALCEAVLHRKLQVEDGTWNYILMYYPKSHMHEYIVRQYFVHESVA